MTRPLQTDLDHKRWLAQVPAERRAALTERLDAPGLVHLTLHLAAICVLSTLIALQVPLWWVLLLPQGILLICLFHLEHEATHYTAFRTRWINTVVGHLAGFVLVLPFRWFVAFHMAHHKWTNIPGRDPELDSPDPTNKMSWLWWLSGFPVWASSIGVLFRLAVGREQPAFLSDRARKGAEREARWMLCGYLCAAVLAMFWPALLWIWVVPVILGQPFLRVYLLAEHGGLPHVSNMFDNTRTTISNRLVRWLTWNMPYHTEHHVWPTVPFHRLPELHEDMAPNLLHLSESYRRHATNLMQSRLNMDQTKGKAGGTLTEDRT